MNSLKDIMRLAEGLAFDSDETFSESTQESKKEYTADEVEKALNGKYKLPEKMKGSTFSLMTVKISDIPNLKNYTVEKITKDYDGDPEHSERIDKYADALKNGKKLPPIVIDGSGRALDGSHRVLAHKKNGIDVVDAFVEVSTQEIHEGKEEKQTWKVTSITGKSSFETDIPPEERTLKNLPRDSKKKAKVKFQSWLCLKKPEEFRGVSGFDASWGMAPDGTFYGWSHRALGSFKIGQKITDDTIGNIKGNESWTIKTKEEALKSAISFAKDVS